VRPNGYARIADNRSEHFSNSPGNARFISNPGGSKALAGWRTLLNRNSGEANERGERRAGPTYWNAFSAVLRHSTGTNRVVDA
jgi:hypothetical protein